MNFVLFVYLAGVVESVSRFLGYITFLAFIVMAVSVLGFIIGFADDVAEHYRKMFCRLIKWAGGLFVVVGLTNSLIPSERTMYMMAAASIAEKVVTSEVASDVQEIVKLKLKSYKTELENKK